MKEPPIPTKIWSTMFLSSVHEAGRFIVVQKNTYLKLLLVMGQSTTIAPLSRTVLFYEHCLIE